MDPSSYQRLSTILSRVLEAPFEDREAVMAKSCGGDSVLLAEVRRMLALAEPEEGVFSDSAVSRRRAEMDVLLDDVQEEAGEWLPERIGSYAIEEVIGRGGTGVVFKAKQERPSRYVAIKLLHPAYASQKTVLRLAREAEFLGTLQHIGIAQIFEAGLFDAGAGEQPFLAMEWIRGRTLLAHADAEKLDTRARTELFAKVVEAVAHAHERGITHRDIKPDNVLVVADSGQPKLLDFGIAAMEEMDGAFRPTADGELLGTVAYMAPEQARRSLGAVGPPTDVYSLGALAFELLAHRPLRQVAGLSITQALGEVAGRDAPRLSGLGLGVPRDLATILEKCLALAPRGRYSSASALAADLRRFLEDRPILARPPSWMDRSVKFTKRHSILVAGAVATTLSLATGLWTTLRQAKLAEALRDSSRRELYAAQMVLATGQAIDPATSSEVAASVDRWREETVRTTPDGRPGWEWLLLDSLRRERVIELDLAGLPLPIAWDPSGDRIAVGFSTGLAIHDPSTGEELAIVSVSDSQTPSTLITTVEWDPYRHDRVFAAGVGAVAAWDVGSEELQWKLDTDFCGSLAPLPDGRLLAAGSEGSMRVLDGDSGEVLDTWPGPYDEMHSLDLHALSQRLLLAQSDGSSAVLDLVTMEPVPGRIPWEASLTCLRWHPDGARFAAASEMGVVVAQAEPWEILHEWNAHEETTFAVDWSADGSLLASASGDRTVRVLDGESGQLLGSFVGHGHVVRDARFSPADRRIASVGAYGKVLVWDADEPDAIRTWLPPDLEPVHEGLRLEWKPQTGTIIAMDSRHLLEWDGVAGGRSRLVRELGRAFESADGGWVFVHGTDGAHGIRDRAGKVALTFDNPGHDPFLQGAWHPTRPHFLAALSGGVYLFRMDEKIDAQPRRIAPMGVQVHRVKWSRDGEAVAIATLARQVKGLRVPSGECLFDLELEVPINVHGLDWSPDGSSVVLGASDGTLRIRSARGDDVAGSTERLFRGHSREVDGLAWHPDGSRIASASRDGTVKLWDPSTGLMMASFKCRSRPTDVAWIRGGAALVAVDIEGRLYTYDATRGIERL
ncbi:Serine/threonine-protein kinase PknB [Planctomycetes bacterium Poly30]|uniref:Serine/threonine-protein kinase PknB n=1 Tax=Saltatorellus ferox TaxID=2528018 RepID=A0A518EL21_9BACT|nr:Serine/threonine-protein kinase PknB [Planctomycetes bacterium Poly30]